MRKLHLLILFAVKQQPQKTNKHFVKTNGDPNKEIEPLLATAYVKINLYKM